MMISLSQHAKFILDIEKKYGFTLLGSFKTVLESFNDRKERWIWQFIWKYIAGIVKLNLLESKIISVWDLICPTLLITIPFKHRVLSSSLSGITCPEVVSLQGFFFFRHLHYLRWVRLSHAPADKKPVPQAKRCGEPQRPACRNEMKAGITRKLP
jgi:hypothetical protein